MTERDSCTWPHTIETEAEADLFHTHAALSQTNFYKRWVAAFLAALLHGSGSCACWGLH